MYIYTLGLRTYNMIELFYEGYTILIGENQAENDNLVRTSNPDDYWVHISGYPSAHGVIKNPQKERIGIKPIKRVCSIIKSKNTKCKSIKNLVFDYTKIKNVVPTDTLGRVILSEKCKQITI